MSAAGPPVMSLPQARRVGVAAQQLTGRRPARVTRANLARMTEHVGVLQIDSVSVLARAHLLPVLARLGPYDLAVLDRATARAPRLLVEEIAHEAAYVPPEVYALLAHRRAARREGSWALSFGAERADLLTRIQAVIGERGALTSREVERVLESPGGRAGWWEWSEVKTALELLGRRSRGRLRARRAARRRARPRTARGDEHGPPGTVLVATGRSGRPPRRPEDPTRRTPSCPTATPRGS